MVNALDPGSSRADSGYCIVIVQRMLMVVNALGGPRLQLARFQACHLK